VLSGDPSFGWGCSKCKGEGWEHGDSKREARGCDGKPASNLGFAFDHSLRRCPWSQIKSETWELLSWWLNWRSLKILPWGGSDIMSQPAVVLETFEVCEGEKNGLEKKNNEKAQKGLRDGG